MKNKKELIIEVLIEKHNLDEKQIKYLKQELKHIRITNDTKLTMEKTQQLNSKKEPILHLLLNNKHLCYL